MEGCNRVAASRSSAKTRACRSCTLVKSSITMSNSPAVQGRGGDAQDGGLRLGGWRVR